MGGDPAELAVRSRAAAHYLYQVEWHLLRFTSHAGGRGLWSVGEMLAERACGSKVLLRVARMDREEGAGTPRQAWHQASLHSLHLMEHCHQHPLCIGAARVRVQHQLVTAWKGAW